MQSKGQTGANKAKKPRVVFTYVEAGFGHIMAMTGMHDAFQKKYGDKCEVVKSYIFSESRSEAVRKMGEALSEHTKKTSYNWLYNRFEALSYCTSSRLTLKILDMHFKSAREEFMGDMAFLSPDLMVSSYYLPSHLAAESNARGITDTLIATYSPDVYIYPAWDRNCHLFMVNNRNAYDIAIKKGFNKDIVRQIPYIYKEEIFKVNETKTEARAELGIDEKFTVLLSSGAYGARGIKGLVKKLLKTDLEINLIVFCGKNEEIKSQLIALGKKMSSKVNMSVMGFTDKLAYYMKASDLLIGKAGYLTIREARYLDCPMVVNAAAHRLEELSANYAEKNCLAKKEYSKNGIIKTIKQCLENPEYLSSQLVNISNYPDEKLGSEKAADLLFDLLKTKFPHLAN